MLILREIKFRASDLESWLLFNIAFGEDFWCDLKLNAFENMRIVEMSREFDFSDEVLHTDQW
jgi:hypothetical protein